MFFIDLLSWWYGPGWVLAFRKIGERTSRIAASFSVGTLLKTLFSPWRRIVTVGAKGLDAKMRALLDNLVSRAVGFVVRIMVLMTAAVMTGLSIIFGVLIAVVWPLVPLLIVYCLVRGLTG